MARRKKSLTGRKERDSKKARVVQMKRKETNEQAQDRILRNSQSQALARSAESQQQTDQRLHQVAQQTRQARATQSAAHGPKFKAALNISELPEELHLGQMSLFCKHCTAVHFQGELVKPHKEEFYNCCHYGKVQLEPLKAYPAELRQLLTGDNAEARNFRQTIRTINNAHAFVSMGAELSLPPNFGPFCYRIHGSYYHKLGPLNPAEGEKHRFAQLYIVDAESALRERKGVAYTEPCMDSVMRTVDAVLRRENPFVKACKFMKEVEREETIKAEAKGLPPPKLTMIFRSDKRDDPRRYNTPAVTEVAAVFVGDPEENLGRRQVVMHSRSDKLEIVSEVSNLCDPMTYPVLFPGGDFGWDINLESRGRRRVSQLQFYSFRLAIRPETFSPIHLAGNLLQQYLVDSYVKVEQSRLNYIKTNQAKLRVDKYIGLSDYIGSEAERRGIRAGKVVILPSSFQGGPRAMQQNYQDAMAIVRKFGKPDLFITMTCNPMWPEIQQNLLPNQRAHDRPDLVARVFQQKLKSLMEEILDDEIFGAVVAHVHVIEFQKRGLPHAHMLFVLAPEDNPRTAEIIDTIVSAEIPENPVLRDLVKSHMIHGPCGVLNPNSPCMTEDKGCRKGYPKEFCDQTDPNLDGYPRYRRRNTGAQLRVGRHVVNNKWVVPHSPYLLAKYRCHINVEICTTFKSVKYLFKYVYKGHDCASVEISREQTDSVARPPLMETFDPQQPSTSNCGPQQPPFNPELPSTTSGAGQENILKYDEVAGYLNARYVSAPEAMWRLSEYALHKKSHTIIRLSVHLPGEQSVYFQEGNEELALDTALVKRSTLQAWFDLNRRDQNAREFLYHELPEHYVFDSQKDGGEWKTRQQRGSKIFGRLYTVSPREVERFHLRLILLHVKGAQSFDSLKTVDTILYGTFYEAARAHGLLRDDSEWEQCLAEAVAFKMPYQLRGLFATILLNGEPQNAQALFDRFATALSEDFFRRVRNADLAAILAWWKIEGIMNSQGRSLTNFGMPFPNEAVHSSDLSADDPHCEMINWQQMSHLFNADQHAAMERIHSSVVSKGTTGPRCFFVDGPGGTGKTFLYKALHSRLTSEGYNVICAAWTGIAANLLPGGRTVHSVFKLPLRLTAESTCSINATSADAETLRSIDVIIWDEAPMAHRHALQAIDLLLRDLTKSSVPFGGKVMLLGGDFRQVLPVVPHGSRGDQVNASIKSSDLWSHFQSIQLKQNMRTGAGESDFAEWLLKVGDGSIPLDENQEMELPEHMFSNDLIQATFGDHLHNGNVDAIAEAVILCPKNVDTLQLNDEIVEELPGNGVNYTSVDTLASDNPTDVTNSPTEFLNSLTPTGLPPHRLTLKEGAIVMLLRNLSQKEGQCNGTRIILKTLLPHVLLGEIITSRFKGHQVLIPRITMRNMDPYGLDFIRHQLPIRLAFAMTINKAQGQTFRKVGLFLPQPVFTHGQLYVALSRVRNAESISIMFGMGQAHRRRTRNVVYQEILGEPLALQEEDLD